MVEFTSSRFHAFRYGSQKYNFSRWKTKKTKIKMPNGWRTIKSLVHKIRLHGRRGKGTAESFSREKLRHAPQKEGGWEILCDLPPVWPRLVRPTNLMSGMNGKKTHNTHTQILVFTRIDLTTSAFIAGVRGRATRAQRITLNRDFYANIYSCSMWFQFHCTCS